ncbi:L-rhamnose mutarotase [Spirosoma foliorum]|uniref:L-rhamnose mutarotase n=1 Tax=Spirosoma foliorum TaxID=2710596 RepID=A0A7G5H6L1_9BACT|nr:L-rhamnose mutarotase [Spirosoma foliorum]QMW06753.1 L-rhamnose mutarotase [Spirosoma foliorum]
MKNDSLDLVEPLKAIYYKRFCKTVELKNDAGLIDAYKKVLAPGAGWPEIAQGMKEVGIMTMELYLLGTTLFMIMDIVADFDLVRAMTELASKPRQNEWEAHIAQFHDITTVATANQKWQLVVMQTH